ncbi:periplasmic heavy metal sensor [Caulobacter segnis]|uniref:Periplasmic heavy metal sensor n=1 Tax=Caulobacter segnis TaxID=88688 RepID=A0A2W5V7F3_9CAUL|nr:periplasmic heavy metal sensor [Caulobacter segnis]PZR32606.1 MAG: hypothetical protein DI526_16160 [Caulobacter segnis]
MNGSRAWMIALAVSAAINVFLIGGVAGMAFVRLTAPSPAPVASPVAPPRPAASGAAPVASRAPASVTEAPRPAHHAARPPVEALPTPVAPPIPSAPPPEAATAPAAAVRPPLISAGDALSPETRQAFRKALNEANRRNRPISQQARAERQAALNALGSPGYDPAEVSRRLATARDLDQQARANVEAALSAFTATLSPQERAILAEGLSKVYAPLAARRQMAGPN